MSRKTLPGAALVAVLVVASAPARPPATAAKALGQVPALAADVSTGSTSGGPVRAAGVAPARPPLIEPVEITAATAPAGPPSVEVLRAWDARRADAWSRGDLAALTDLYTPGSVAGRRDRAMLRAWTTRGLVVRGLRTQLLAVDELSRSASTWTLRVTDRLAGGVAVGRGLRRALPRDEATTRTVRLRLVGGRWVVASVEAAQGPQVG